jgi:hypothetical protein
VESGVKMELRKKKQGKSWDEFECEVLQNSEVHREYDALIPKYNKIRAKIVKQIKEKAG